MKYKPRGYWTLEKLQEEADKYLTRDEFRKNSHGGYSIAIQYKLINILFKNHINNGYVSKKHESWTIEKLQEKANSCLTRGEFWKKESNAASIANKNDLLDDLFKNHNNSGYTYKQVKEGYWSKELLQIEVKKYNNRTEFRKYNNKAYRSAVTKKILNELFENHINNGYLNNDDITWNKYVIYVYEFKKYNKAYIGLTNNVMRRDKQHIWSKTEKMSLFCKEKNIPIPKYKILEKNLISSDAQNKEKY